MEPLRIRPYEPEDLGGCRALWAHMVERHRAIYEDPGIGGDDPGREFDAHLERVGSKRVWVAESGPDLVGMTALILEGQEAEVEPIVVAPGQRGRGVGQQLLERAVEEARAAGVLCLSAKPVARNEAAIAFFFDAGFRTLGHVQMFTWLGEAPSGAWKPGPTLHGRQFDC